jgi:hypothetical protein
MERGLNGVLTTRVLFTNAWEVLTGFGFKTYFRCWKAVLTGERTTFLSLAVAF